MNAHMRRARRLMDRDQGCSILALGALTCALLFGALAAVAAPASGDARVSEEQQTNGTTNIARAARRDARATRRSTSQPHVRFFDALRMREHLFPVCLFLQRTVSSSVPMITFKTRRTLGRGKLSRLGQNGAALPRSRRSCYATHPMPSAAISTMPLSHSFQRGDAGGGEPRVGCEREHARMRTRQDART